MLNNRIFLLSSLSGVLLGLPWLSAHLAGSVFFAFVPLLLAETLLIRQNKSARILSFYSGFLAFLIWNILSTWWIGYVSVVGMLLISGINAIFMASVWWAAGWIRRQYGALSGFFALVVFWTSFESLQHNWTIQWPWLTLGNGLANSVKIIQWYEFTGVLGGSLWILLSNILIFLLVKSLLDKSFLQVLKFSGYLVFVFCLPVFLSFYLYSSFTEKGAEIEVAVLQPNIDPYTQKFSGMSQDLQIRKLDSLAESIVSGSTSLVVAPETALPVMWEGSILNGNPDLQLVSGIIHRFPNVSLITGALTKRKSGANETVSETARRSSDGSYSYDIFNSALLFDRSEKVQISHKSILVSGVEKMPFQNYFTFLDHFALNLGGANGSLASAVEPAILKLVNGVIIGPVICFESAFGQHSADLVRKGAQLLVVITNDGWWKDSPGSWQHFGYSRIRALETRRSIARSANTGISGFIDQRGEVLKKSGISACTSLRANIHLNDELTFYANHGDFIGRICLLLSGFIIIYLLGSWISHGR